MSDKTILLVDDEPHIIELIKLYMAGEPYNIETACSGTEALGKFASLKPALIVLDLMLPEIDGWEVCRRIRRESDVPIIMLTARTDDVDKIVGLELGADDYVGKPFNPRELTARIKAVLRRASAPERVATAGRPPLDCGNTRIDQDRHEVKIAGKKVELRVKEFDLLVAFVQHMGLVLERDKLLNIVWGYEYFGDTRTVDVHVAHLRDRLAGSTINIQTIRGVGYKAVLTD
jgi:two-component system, OmpR family, alkaline phosphatase synthesis response regulator PhoP